MRKTYRVSFKVILFLPLEALEIFEYTCAGIFDVLLRYVEGLLELHSR